MRGRLASSLSVRVFVYPTEEEERVKSALRSLLSLPESEPPALSTSEFRSVHGYRFKEIRVEVSSPTASAVLEKVLRALPESDVRYLLSTLRSRIHRGHLYVRLDKQAMVLGEVRLDYGGLGGHVRLDFKLVVGPEELRGLISEVTGVEEVR
ncbi:MAG: hypothetical protein DRO06_01225 [Thermoproteota archaeon]|nr:MAG: hypothetical protein DRO06_01225 [Candidatus Korarchaeota archaeon]